MSAPPPDYVLIGHISADLVGGRRTPGGTVAYAARVARAFGWSVAVLTSAAPDDPLLTRLTSHAAVINHPAAATTTFENRYTPTGREQVVRAAAADLAGVMLPASWSAAPLVHLAPLLGEVDPCMARAFPGARVLLTLQGLLRRRDATGRVHFRHGYQPAVLDAVDLVVLSEEDIAAAPQLEADLAGAVRCLVVTRAARGGTYYLDGTPHHYSAPPVREVQPTGAGDVFAAALLASLPLLGNNIHVAVQVAARLGARAVTRHGLAGAPTPHEAQGAVMALKPK